MSFATQCPGEKLCHHRQSGDVTSLKSLSFELQNDNGDGYFFFVKVSEKMRFDPEILTTVP